MDRIVQGAKHFAQTTVAEEREFFQGLGEGQAPEALFITCADSRVVPNLLTNSQPGEIFVLRNAGNIVPAHGSDGGGASATVEYAVAVLGIKHIVVCGHTGCGAMKALLDPNSTAHLPATSAWLRHAEPVRQVVRILEPGGDAAACEVAAIKVNVVQQLCNLRTHPSVAAALYGGNLTLHGWVYDIQTGVVRAYDPMTQAFVPLGEARPAAAGGLFSALNPGHRTLDG